MAKIRIGSVGLGGVSSGVHIPGIRASADLALTALCDIDAERLREKAAAYGVDEAHCFTDYRDLAACPDVDAVDISAPNDVHLAAALAAVAAGKPYNLEKPITLDAAEGKRLLEATRAAGVKSMIDFSYRYKASARFLREILLSGRLGKIYHVNMQYYQAWGREGEDCPLVWRFVRENAGSGALGDLGCHALDLVEFVTGERYRRVCAHNGTFVEKRRLLSGEGSGAVDVDDYSNIFAEMESGAAFSFQISRFCYGRGNYQRMEVYGEDGALVYHLDRVPGRDELEIASAETGGKFESCEIPEHCRADQMQAFADLVLGRGDGLSATIEDGYRNQCLLDAILRSAETGTWAAL